MALTAPPRSDSRNSGGVICPPTYGSFQPKRVDLLLEVVMADYRIRPVGEHFEVIDSAADRVRVCDTEREAKQEIDICS